MGFGVNVLKSPLLDVKELDGSDLNDYFEQDVTIPMSLLVLIHNEQCQDGGHTHIQQLISPCARTGILYYENR